MPAARLLLLFFLAFASCTPAAAETFRFTARVDVVSAERMSDSQVEAGDDPCTPAEDAGSLAQKPSTGPQITRTRLADPDPSMPRCVVTIVYD